MADQPREGSSPQVASAPAAPVVIKHLKHLGGEPLVKDWRQLVPAWTLSGVIHIVLLAIFLLIQGPSRGVSALLEDIVVETKVEEDAKDYNLENTDIGLNPDLPTNYNIPRIEDVSVPGPVNANEKVGILNDDPNAAPHTIPPPPGLGDNTGQGGGADSSVFGKGNVLGYAGGMGGPLMKPGGFGGRSGATREQMLQEGGGNAASEAAVARALEWFAKHQSSDGHWSIDNYQNAAKGCNCQGVGQQHNDIAATAFGLLPLLGAGQTHKGSSNQKNTGRYTKNVERALKYLMVKQNAEGNFGGGMYAHGLATIAMCEAFGLTNDPSLQKPAQKAINFIVKAQSDNGGWRYVPRGGGDTSVVGWQVMALTSGKLAGLDVPTPTLDGAKKWLDSCASPDGGSYGYQKPPENYGASAMTAVGLLCREYLGWGPKNPGLQAGIQALKGLPPKRSPSMYYSYYATQVMHHFGGKAWEDWNKEMRDLLIDRQDKGSTPKHDHQLGSWSPLGDAHNGAGGRIMITSLSALTLEVYYRHLPLYRRDIVAGISK
jgi:hypothetical protein